MSASRGTMKMSPEPYQRTSDEPQLPFFAGHVTTGAFVKYEGHPRDNAGFAGAEIHWLGEGESRHDPPRILIRRSLSGVQVALL